MNATTYTADASASQGQKNYSRREAMASVAALALSASAVAADAAEMIHPTASDLADLIARHRAADWKWTIALNERIEAEARLKQNLEEDPISFTLRGPSGRVILMDAHGIFPTEIAFQITSESVRHLLQTRSYVHPDSFDSRITKIQEDEKANLSMLISGNDELIRRQYLVGLEAADQAEDIANDEERMAFGALLQFRPSSLSEAAERIAYLTTSTKWEIERPADDELRIFFASMLPSGGCA